MSQWQPIETAPKDGTEIILFQPGQLVTSGWFDTWDEFATGVECLCGWVIDWNDEFQEPNATLEATHWMPLPEPPNR